MRKGKILILILMALFCLSFKTINISAEELPPCDLSFYNIDKLEVIEAGIDLTCASNELCAKYCPKSSKICFDTGLASWGSGSRNVAASLRVNDENTVKSWNMTIYEEHSDGSTPAVCAYYQPIDNATPGQNIAVTLSIGSNEKDSTGGWKYGHIFTIHFGGTYIDKSGNVNYYKDDHITLRREGQLYSNGRTPKTTLANGESVPSASVITTANYSSAGIAKATSSKEMTKVVGNNDMACNTIGELFDDYWPYVMVIVPILLIVMMAIDFFKAMSSNDAEALTKASSNTLKRTIATIIILALPALLKIIFDIMGLDFCL